jgi:hypothetical protein
MNAGIPRSPHPVFGHPPDESDHLLSPRLSSITNGGEGGRRPGEEALGILCLGLAALLVVGASGCATHRTTQAMLRLGESTIPVHVYHHGSAQPTMINVHDDENTSVVAGKAVVKASGGRVIELAHSGKRLVSFNLDGTTYRFDPNRIFSDEGIAATLRRQGNYSEAAHAAVKQFTAELIARFQLDVAPALVALHNTTNGGLAIDSYQPNRPHESTAARVHTSPRRSPGDFFYVTDPRFFDYLATRDFNVTLQDNATVPDDGSMSVYFGRKGIPYVNIEADETHLAQQIEMVRAVHDILGELHLAAPLPARR